MRQGGLVMAGMKISLLAASLLVAVLASAPQARAAADDVNWVEHAGNGTGATGALSNGFQAISVLHNGSRFPTCNGSTCVSIQGMSKTVAFGLKPTTVNGQPTETLHRMLLGDDGVSPQPANAAVLTDSATGQDLPFLLSEERWTFDVLYDKDQAGGPFVIYYRGSVSPAATTSELRRAVSMDGIRWTNETALSDVDPATPVVGAGRASYGVSDVILQTGGGLSSTCTALPLASNYPWNCKYVMVYDASTPNHTIAITGSTNGTAFRGLPGSLLLPGPGASWDGGGVTMGRIRRVGAQFQLYYNGMPSGGPLCVGGDSDCFSLGVATSATGFGFVKSAGNPLVASTRYDQLGGITPSSVWGVSIVEDGGAHAKLYLSRRMFDRGMQTYLAYSAPAPTSCPSIRVSSPQDGFLTTKPNPVDVYLNDTLGFAVGVDLSTLSLKIDGVAVGGAQYQDTMVGTYNNAAFGKRAFIPTSQLPTLAGGAHTFTVSIADFDGNTCSVTTNFVIDKTPPSTSVSLSPAGPAVAQFYGVGRYQGTTTDAGIGLERIRANVTNPLGQVKSYYSTDPSGWQVTKASANTWDWSWVGPTLDPHFALPGSYRISFVGQDLASNIESASGSNTATILVL